MRRSTCAAAAVLALVALPTPTQARDLEDSLASRWRGAWVLTAIDTYSDCGGIHTNNLVHGSLVESRGHFRFKPGELAQVKDLDLKHAKLVSVQGGDAAFNLLATGQVEALAGLKQGLIGLAEKLPGSRIVDGRFMGVQQSIAVPKGRDAGLAFLKRVVEDAKASGLVARAIEKTGAKGVSVAAFAK